MKIYNNCESRKSHMPKSILLSKVFLFLKETFYCYSITDVPIVSSLPSSGHPLSYRQSPHYCPCPWVIHTYSFTSTFSFFLLLFLFLLPSGHCQPVPCFHACGSGLLVSLFCSLDSPYKWDHMVFVFHWLAYFTWHNALQFHPYCHEGEELLLSAA